MNDQGRKSVDTTIDAIKNGRKKRTRKANSQKNEGRGKKLYFAGARHKGGGRRSVAIPLNEKKQLGLKGG